MIKVTWPFLILAVVTVSGAVGAMAFRNLVHCVFSLVAAFAGLAGLFLQLNAEFVGLVQILVYVGAVAILVVFAILLTRGADPAPPASVATSSWWGIGLAGATFVALCSAVLGSVMARRGDLTEAAGREPTASVRSIGDQLMQDYVLPLEVLGLLLTAALIGAIVIAMQDNRRPANDGPSTPSASSSSSTP